VHVLYQGHPTLYVDLQRVTIPEKALTVLVADKVTRHKQISFDEVRDAAAGGVG
jgi:hypothetical protein